MRRREAVADSASGGWYTRARAEGRSAMMKWKLMLTTLPFVVVVMLAKVVLEQLLGVEGWLQFSEVSPVLTAGAFLIGFMLAGTMSDYKESEKLPGDLATTLETLEDVVTICANRKNLDGPAMRAQLYEVTSAIADWLGHQQPIQTVYASMTRFGGVVEDVDKSGAGSFAVRLTTELHNLRKMVTRIEVISKTGFLPTGYALLEMMVLVIVILLLCASYQSLLAEYGLLTFITLIYVYMIRLIHDIDDPFEFGPDLKRRGSAEVDLFPFTDYRDRARERLAVDAAAAEPPLLVARSA
jgi:hypothetical protein